MGHGEALHHLLGMAELAAGGFQEFEPGRGGEEEIGQFDPRPAAERRRLRPGLGAGLDGQAPGRLGPLLAAGDGEPPDGADGGQCLAAESQGGDMGQIVARQLGGGMALHRQGQLLGRHAEPVIHHLDQIAPAILQGDVDAPGAGIDGVLHQLLHGRGRALDHLAGGDAVDDIGRQESDGHDPGTVAERPCRRHDGAIPDAAAQDILDAIALSGKRFVRESYSPGGGLGSVALTPAGGLPRRRKRRAAAS